MRNKYRKKFRRSKLVNPHGRVNFLMDLVDANEALGFNVRKGLTLGQVFNNLRWYVLLLVLFAVVKYLFKSTDPYEIIAARVLMIFTVIIAVAVMWQTVLMLNKLGLSMTKSLPFTKWLPSIYRLRKNQKNFKSTFVVLVGIGSLSVLCTFAFFHGVIGSDIEKNDISKKLKAWFGDVSITRK